MSNIFNITKPRKKLEEQWEYCSENIKITSEAVQATYPWTEFSAFEINNETIYVFNQSKPIESLYWDRDKLATKASYY